MTAKDRPQRGFWHYLRLGLGWGLLGLVAGLGVLVIGLPAATGSTPLTVLTGSMEPTLPPGTLVIVKPTAPQDIRLGDVLTYQIRPGKPEVVSHRVVEVRSISDGSVEFLTKGDNNGAVDPAPVTAAQIKGTIWYSVPWVGWASIAVGGKLSGLLVPIAGIGLLGYAGALIFSALFGKKKRGARHRATPMEPALPLAD
jgi:signal peptidase